MDRRVFMRNGLGAGIGAIVPIEPLLKGLTLAEGERSEAPLICVNNWRFYLELCGTIDITKPAEFPWRRFKPRRYFAEGIFWDSSGTPLYDLERLKKIQGKQIKIDLRRFGEPYCEKLILIGSIGPTCKYHPFFKRDIVMHFGGEIIEREKWNKEKWKRWTSKNGWQYSS